MHVLVLTLTAQVDLTVSGDKDLLDLNPFPILAPAEALRAIETQK